MRTISDMFSQASAKVRQAKAAPAAANPLVLATGDNSGLERLGASDKNDVGEAEQYAHNQGSVYSAVNIPSKRLAGQPAFVGRITATAAKGKSLKAYLNNGLINRHGLPMRFKEMNPENVEIIENHPLVESLNSPNEMMTRWSLFYVTAVSLQITGKAFWMLMPGKAENGEPRTEFLYLPATWVKPVHHNGLYTGWLVGPPGSSDEPIPVMRENMAYFAQPNPADPLSCLSPLQRMARTVLADESIQIAQEVAFKNGIFPVMGITVGDEASSTFPGGGGSNMRALNPTQRSQLQEYIRGQYQGARKYGLPFILDALMRDVKQLTTNPNEMAFQEAGEMTESRVYKGFGVNPISAGQIEGANKASSAVADHHLVSNVVNPLISLISQTVTKNIAPHFSDGGMMEGQKSDLVFWIQPAVAHDPEAELERWRYATENMAVTRNEVRGYINLPPIDGWDDVAMPVQVEGGQDTVGFVGSNEDIDANAEAAKAVDAIPKDFQEVYQKARRALWEKQHGKLEEKFSDAIFKFFSAQVDEVVDQLKAMDRKDAASDLTDIVYDEPRWYEALLKEARPHVLRGLLQGAAAELATLPKHLRSKTRWVKEGDSNLNPFFEFDSEEEFEAATGEDDFFGPADVDDDDVVNVLIELPDDVKGMVKQALDDVMREEYWQDLGKTTQDKLKSIIDKALNEGKTPGQMAKMIREGLGPDLLQHRAKLIARTEATNALNAGQDSVNSMLAADGLVSGKEWVTVGDGRVRGAMKNDKYDHQAANGQRVRPDDDFEVSGQKTPWPGHPSMAAGNRINCRCTVVSLFAGTVPEGALPEAEQ